MIDSVVVVAIGRNEGQRLVRCLESLQAEVPCYVYVDSGSRDGSAERARALGADVVVLSSDRPFSAARARNSGFERALQVAPAARYVQFVDGDCELAPGWLAAGVAHLEGRPEVAAVCGRRRECAPDHSPYNRLIDIEWDTPVGETETFGGDVLIRADVFAAVGGYACDLIAGEDPELALRVRQAGHRIVRLPDEMTRHDAALERFGQWWQRSRRAGYAYADLLLRHGPRAARSRLSRVFSAAFWAGAVPLGALAGFVASGAGLVMAGLFIGLAATAEGFLFWRVRLWALERGLPPAHARLYAVACTAAKLPQLIGVVQLFWDRMLGRRRGLIEYKHARRSPKILAVASGGGHWVQLMRVRPAFAAYDCVYVTVQEAARSDVAPAPFYLVRSATRWQPLGSLILFFQVLRILVRERPHVVLSTGAAPGCIAVVLGALLGCRTLWLDSVANVEQLSLSGRIALRFASLSLTQWKHLSSPDGPEYAGTIF